ncbi:MAG: hypothetical protein A2087_04385 [Spirochaetes bacterium GWD1_61_31]|nr:MAG: hypothetical protein A2004_09745 [Spirochaetes bacterium GWC1_61_12]OHD35446.1 MAG: hypothetical protein A2087_04385 [Spirochaetes bacterium GWD1_61_31]
MVALLGRLQVGRESGMSTSIARAAPRRQGILAKVGGVSPWLRGPPLAVPLRPPLLRRTPPKLRQYGRSRVSGSLNNRPPLDSRRPAAEYFLP